MGWLVPKEGVTRYYTKHHTPDTWRWWEDSNYGDQFDLINTEETYRCVAECQTHGIATVDHLPNDDED